MPLFGVYVAVSAVAGRLTRRLGVRTTLTVGLIIGAAGSLLLVESPSNDSYAWVWPGMVLFGVGAGFVLAPTTAASIASVPHEAAGMASASMNMFRQLGNVLGASVLGTVLATRFATLLPERLTGSGVPSAVVDQVSRPGLCPRRQERRRPLGRVTGHLTKYQRIHRGHAVSVNWTLTGIRKNLMVGGRVR